jgi:hypothetical protein
MRKNAAIAAILGVLFGCFGIGLYFRSWQAFLVCGALQLGLLLIPLPPLNLAFSWAAAATYGAIRASKA